MGAKTNLTANDAQGLAKAYKQLLEISALKIIKPWLQSDILFRWLDKKNYECSMQSNKLVQEFVSKIVECKQVEWQEQKKLHTNAITNIAKMLSGKDDAATATTTTKYVQNDALDSVDENGIKNMPMQKRIFIEQMFHFAEMGEMTLQEIIDESQSMVLVSFETVSNSIIIALLCLAMNCECQHKLRHEINEIFANETASIGKITPIQLQQMKYLDMIVSESLRLLTTVPMNMRHVSKDFQLHLARQKGKSRNEHRSKNAVAEGVVIVPKDTVVVLDTFNMQRDVANWGLRAQQFYPEHFAATKSERHPYTFLPFSKGLRWCIGWRYSLFLMKILLIKLISSFEFRTETKLENLRFIDGISLKFQNPNSITFQIHKITKNN